MLKQISFDKIESQIDNSSSRHSKIKNQFLNQTLIAKKCYRKKTGTILRQKIHVWSGWISCKINKRSKEKIEK